MRPRLRLAAMLAGFFGFTALGVLWSAPGGDVLARTGHELVAIGAANAALLLAIAFAAIGAEVLRVVVFGWVIDARIAWRTAFDAALANNLFSWLSPGGVLGEPAGVYVMAKRGVSLEVAIVVSFGKFATSFALIMGLACVLLVLGYGPAIPEWAIVSIAATIGFGVVLVGSFVVGAVRPVAARRLLDRLAGWLTRKPRGPRTTRVIARATHVAHQSLDRLAAFRAHGAAGWFAVFGTHVLYYGAYVGLLVALGWMFDASSLVAIVPIAIIYQAFTYIAPTPGLPEAAAGLFFGGLLPASHAFVVVLLFRALTAYLHVVLGVLYLPAAAMLRANFAREPPPRS